MHILTNYLFNFDETGIEVCLLARVHTCMYLYRLCVFFCFAFRPTNDLALLILSSLPSKVRRDNTQKLLNHYYTMMKENLNKINIDIEVTLNYTKEKLLDDYK